MCDQPPLIMVRIVNVNGEYAFFPQISWWSQGNLWKIQTTQIEANAVNRSMCLLAYFKLRRLKRHCKHRMVSECRFL